MKSVYILLHNWEFKPVPQRRQLSIQSMEHYLRICIRDSPFLTSSSVSNAIPFITSYYYEIHSISRMECNYCACWLLRQKIFLIIDNACLQDWSSSLARQFFNKFIHFNEGQFSSNSNIWFLETFHTQSEFFFANFFYLYKNIIITYISIIFT